MPHIFTFPNCWNDPSCVHSFEVTSIGPGSGNTGTTFGITAYSDTKFQFIAGGFCEFFAKLCRQLLSCIGVQIKSEWSEPTAVATVSMHH